MTNAILVLIILAVVGGAIVYLYRAKKSGRTCVGCPNSKQCGKATCNCNTDNKDN